MTELIGAFFTAALLFNAIPHLVQGICGKKHMSPFSAESSAVTNVLWGCGNLVVGALIGRASHWEAWTASSWIAFGAGGLGLSLYLAIFWSNPDARLPWHKDQGSESL